jgi:SAM-dependent methyltransferase
MSMQIDTVVLKDIASHHRACGFRSRLHGLPYERCAELSWVVRHLHPQFNEHFRYLDVGTGESPLPTFLLRNSQWQITCLDKCQWIRAQHRFLQALNPNGSNRRFHVVEGDLLEAELTEESFDVITLISVIEHFEGNSDSAAMRRVARLLRPGGQCILTTPVNEPFFREFYVRNNVYGSRFGGAPVYYQRHYDVRSLAERIIGPSGLIEQHRVYFGDYGFQCFEKVLQTPKPLRAFYLWSAPWLASRFASYEPHPVSRRDMRMNTASGAILVLQKPALA